MASGAKTFNKSFLKIIIWTAVLSLFLSATASAFDFQEWNDILEKYVAVKTVSGIRLHAVDYKKLRNDPAFARLLARLKNARPLELKSGNSRLSFWINVYNILAVKMVLDHYPVESIKDAGGLFSPVWKKDAGVVGGTQRTLHEIEHEILRKMGDPRIHSAIVCASVSCPDLRMEAFIEDRVDKQLDDQMKTFLANPLKGMRIEGDKIFLSSIFKWFREDFEAEGGVLKLLSRFAKTRDGTKIASGELDVRYLDYNWNLNGH